MARALLRGLVLATGGTASLAGCAGAGDGAAGGVIYLGADVEPVDAALFRFNVALQGGGAAEVETYARCAAAGYAQEKGFGFVRHLSTEVNERGGIWRADALYTISPGLPRGVKTIDAEVTVADCEDQGIPTA